MKLGTYDVSPPVVLAPMAGITNMAFRLLCREFGALHSQDDGGLLVRTNHFVSEGGHDGCLASTLSVSTELRRAHLVETFSGRVPQTADDVVDAMTHHIADGGVCRHNFADPDPVLWHRTLATVVIDVRGRTLEATEGGPCGQRLAEAG